MPKTIKAADARQKPTISEIYTQIYSPTTKGIKKHKNPHLVKEVCINQLEF